MWPFSDIEDATPEGVAKTFIDKLANVVKIQVGNRDFSMHLESIVTPFMEQ